MFDELAYPQRHPYKTEKISESEKATLKRILNEKQNILIVGEQGAGKTSFLNWILRNLPSGDTLMIFDVYHELQRKSYPGKSVVVGYNESSDVVGVQSQLNPHADMIKKAMLVPFERIIADDLSSKEILNVLSSFHGTRSGIFTLPVNLSN